MDGSHLMFSPCFRTRSTTVAGTSFSSVSDTLSTSCCVFTLHKPQRGTENCRWACSRKTKPLGDLQTKQRSADEVLISSRLASCPCQKSSVRNLCRHPGTVKSICSSLKLMFKFFSEMILLNVFCQLLRIPLQQCNHGPLSSPYMSSNQLHLN